MRSGKRVWSSSFLIIKFNFMKNVSKMMILTLLVMATMACQKLKIGTDTPIKVKDNGNAIFYADMSLKSAPIYESIFDNTNGDFCVGAFQSMASKMSNIPPHITINGSYDYLGSRPSHYSVKLNGETYSTNSSGLAIVYDYSTAADVSPKLGLFGTSTSLSLRDSAMNPLVSLNMNTPSMASYQYANGITDVSKITLDPRVGATINWTADATNSNGVYFVISEFSIQADNMPKVETQVAFLTEDDGTAQLTPDMFAPFPAGCKVVIDMYRANCTSGTTTQGKSFKYFSYSQFYSLATLK
jgi:hypothetical protein